jgi:PhnB protein
MPSGVKRSSPHFPCLAGLIHSRSPGHHGGVRNPPPGYQTVSPYLLYEDARRVIEHLKTAFGFEERLTQTGGAGRSHTELVLGDDGLVMIGQAWEGFSSPRTLGAHPPSLIHVYVNDVEALYERAGAAGADVTDLEMSPAGDRRFTATDPEGQVWVFAQRVADPGP